MSPYFQNDGEIGWYFELFECIFGPYDSEDIAWDKYDQVIGIKGGCKNCGD